MSDLPSIVLPPVETVDTWRRWRRRKPRYYTTPYWPCPFHGVRMRYLYFSSRINIELGERVVERGVTATIRPVGWALSVGFKRKRIPVPENLRNVLCVYVDARHVGHVEYLGEEAMTYGELERRGDLLALLGVEPWFLRTLARKVVTGWKHEPTPDTRLKVVYFRWVDNLTAVALGYMKRVSAEEVARLKNV